MQTDSSNSTPHIPLLFQEKGEIRMGDEFAYCMYFQFRFFPSDIH